MKIKNEKSAFLEQLGDTPQLRVIDFLIGEHFFDFPLTEIARKSEISYNSLKSFFDKLLETGLIIKTRRIGKSDYYKLDEQNQIVQNMIKLAWQLTKQKLNPEKYNPKDLNIELEKKEIIVN